MAMSIPKSGDRVSEYVLDQPVGAGSFGQVWKARHHIWKDQVVAIKIPTDSQYVRNLQKEGVVVHGLKHANIVRAIGLDPYADPPYFAMEFVDGCSLRDLLRKHPKGLPLSAAREILRGLLAALSCAHDAGLIHRDIKPENILISSGGDRSLDTITADDVKVTDFGLGFADEITANSIMQSGSLLAEDGKTISGTIAYMAPEQRDGLPVDARSDLYAVGIVLFEMLTGERPSGGDLPRVLRGDLPSWADAIFSRLYTRRERRFASAADVLAALSEASRPPVVAGTTRKPPVSGIAAPCPRCRHPSTAGDSFCIMCGMQLVAAPRQCRACGAYPDPTDQFCIFCGMELAEAMA